MNDDTIDTPSFTAPDVSIDSSLYFYLIVNDDKISSEPDTVMIHVNNVVGLKDNDLDGKFDVHIFPNPTTDIVTIDILSPASDKIKVDLINLNGEVIESNLSHVVSDNKLIYKIETGDLNPGVYYLSITSDNYKESYKLMVIR